MSLDQDRIRAILKADHSYYAGSEIPTRQDRRWHLGWMTDLMQRQLTPASRVLDAGCGKGHILMEMYQSFQSGLGVDTDPDFLRMAEEAKREQGIQNVDFLLLDFPREAAQLEPESFDLVMSIRGPVTDTAEGLQAAHHLLRPDGLLFCQEIGELHHREEVETYWGDTSQAAVRRVDQVRALMEQNGFEVRLAADLIMKEYYPDLYAWLHYVCNIWAWLGAPFPEPDDHRLARFAELNTIATGEIQTTNHVCWVGAVKK